MKRICIILTMFLTCLIFLAAPIGSSAADDGSSVEAAMTKEVSVWVDYPVGTTPPDTYYYDRGGWKGTIYLVGSQSTPDFVIANYKGTVSCHGTCVVGGTVD